MLGEVWRLIRVHHGDLAGPLAGSSERSPWVPRIPFPTSGLVALAQWWVVGQTASAVPVPASSTGGSRALAVWAGRLSSAFLPSSGLAPGSPPVPNPPRRTSS